MYRLNFITLIKISILTLSALCLMITSGCDATDMESTETGLIARGSVIGSEIGTYVTLTQHYNLLGASTAIASGALLGTYTGFKLLTLRDDYVMRRAAYQGIANNQFGKKIFWYNWATGNAGTFILRRSFYDEQQRLCKIKIIHIGIIQQRQVEVICQMPSKDWMITDSIPLPELLPDLIQILPPNKKEIKKQLIYQPHSIRHTFSTL